MSLESVHCESIATTWPPGSNKKPDQMITEEAYYLTTV